MKKLKDIAIDILAEASGGQAAGKMELTKTPFEKANAYREKAGLDFENFEERYKFAQSRAAMGKTKRKDMPVVGTDDVERFKMLLQKGYLDVAKPMSDDPLFKNNPFPEKLSGKSAKRFLQKGLKRFDGSIKDDKLNPKVVKVPVKNLKPIQEQIYFDKVVDDVKRFTIDGSRKFIQSATFVISSDNYIIDGHHRYLASLLIDPSMSVKCLKIDLPIKTLIPLARSFGDAIGNKRNL